LGRIPASKKIQDKRRRGRREEEGRQVSSDLNFRRQYTMDMTCACDVLAASREQLMILHDHLVINEGDQATDAPYLRRKVE
jgi:hypothetical protein